MKIPLLSRRDEDLLEIVRGTSLALGLRILGRAFGFGFNVLLARLLGAEGAGVYYLALTCTTIATVFGRLGLDNALLRYVAAASATGDWDQVAGVYRQAVRIAGMASGAASFLLFVLAPWIAASIFREPALAAPLRVMAFAVIPASLVNLQAESLKAVRRAGLATFLQGAAPSVFCLLLLSALWTKAGEPAQVALIYTVSMFGVFGLGIWFWSRSAPEARGRRGYFEGQRLMTTALPLLWISSMNLLMSFTDTIMLGIWTETQQVGLYNVAARIALLTTFILVAVNTMVAPKFAAFYEREDRSALGRIARQSATIATLFALPALIILIVWPAPVLSIFGAEFMAASTTLTILAVGQFINVATGSVGYLLMMTGHERIMRNNLIFSALLNVALNWRLIPMYGIRGAAAATALSLITMNLVSMALVYRKLSILTIPWRGPQNPNGVT